MRLRRSLALNFLSVVAIHGLLIYSLMDFKKTYIGPSSHDPIQVSLAAEKSSRINKSIDENQSMMESRFLKNVSIKEAGEFKSQELHLETSQSFEFGEIDIQIEQRSELPKPHYPLLSKRLKEQGDVLVRACIVRDESRNTLTIYKSSGHHRLDQSALDAVKRWKDVIMMRLQPSTLRCYQIPIRFRLTSE